MDNTRRSSRLSDKDILLDILNTEKQLSHLYDHAVLEATSLEIHNAMEEFQRDGHENSFTIQNTMQQRGWYNTAAQNQSDRQPTPSGRTRLGRKRNYSLANENRLSSQSQFFPS